MNLRKLNLIESLLDLRNGHSKQVEYCVMGYQADSAYARTRSLVRVARRLCRVMGEPMYWEPKNGDEIKHRPSGAVYRVVGFDPNEQLYTLVKKPMPGEATKKEFSQRIAHIDTLQSHYKPLYELED
jgi:hypothetical protein